MFLEKYPYTDFNEYNLDWIIINIKKLLNYFEGPDQLATVKYVDEQIAAAKDILEAMISDLDDAVSNLENKKLDKSDFNAFLIELQISLNSITGNIETLRQATAANAQAIIKTYNDLKNYIDSQLIDLQVINPLTGESEPIQLVLNYMANMLRDDALTATEYDSAELTATAYDALDLTAYDYDNFGKNYITI